MFGVVRLRERVPCLVVVVRPGYQDPSRVGRDPLGRTPVRGRRRPTVNSFEDHVLRQGLWPCPISTVKFHEFVSVVVTVFDSTSETVSGKKVPPTNLLTTPT